MEIGKCRLKLNSGGSDIPIFNLTPAEVLVLRAGHEVSAGGDPISGVELLGKVNLSDAEEIGRLREKYKNLKFRDGDKDVEVVKHLFSGHGAKVPQTFAEVGIGNAPVAKVREPQDYTPEAKDAKPVEIEPITEVEPTAPKTIKK